MNRNKSFLFLLAICIPITSFSLGDRPPKTPQQQAEQKITILKGVALTSQFTAISFPVPNNHTDPIEFTVQGVDVTVELDKIRFEKLYLSGVDQPIESDGHPMWIAGMEFGKFVIGTNVTARLPIGRLKLYMNIEIQPAFLPMNIHALEQGTRLEIVPENRKDEVYIGQISISVKDFPDFVDRELTRMVRDQIGPDLMAEIPTLVLDIPNL